MFQAHFVEAQVLLCDSVLSRHRPAPVQGLEVGTLALSKLSFSELVVSGCRIWL